MFTYTVLIESNKVGQIKTVLTIQ